jgi:hypothetical protein
MRLLLIAIVVVLASGSVAASPARASTAQDGRVISSVLYPYPCLDVDPATMAGNGSVRTWECNGTDWQRWWVDYPASDIHTHHI